MFICVLFVVALSTEYTNCYGLSVLVMLLFEKTVDELEGCLIFLYLYFQGEPYLHPQFSELVAYASQKNIIIVCFENIYIIQPLPKAVAKKAEVAKAVKVISINFLFCFCFCFLDVAMFVTNFFKLETHLFSHLSSLSPSLSIPFVHMSKRSTPRFN